MPERNLTEYSDASVRTIDTFAAERGLTRVDAINHMLMIAGFVSDQLLKGNVFYIKVNNTLHEVEWNEQPKRSW